MNSTATTGVTTVSFHDSGRSSVWTGAIFAAAFAANAAAMHAPADDRHLLMHGWRLVGAHVEPKNQTSVVSTLRLLDEQISNALGDLYGRLVESQVELDADILQAVHQNLWDLYS